MGEAKDNLKNVAIKLTFVSLPPLPPLVNLAVLLILPYSKLNLVFIRITVYYSLSNGLYQPQDLDIPVFRNSSPYRD